MSGAQTTLSLQDRLTGPLMKMMKAMDSTIRAMEKMDSATNNLDQKSLANARKNITNASADLERLRTSMSQTADSASKAAQQQSKLNDTVNKMPTASKTDGMVKAMDNMASSADKASKSQEQYNRTMNAMKPPTFIERIRNIFSNTGKEAEIAASKQAKFNTVMQQLRPSSILERLRHIIKSAGDSADKAASQQDKFNKSVNDGLSGLKGLAAGLLGAVGAYKAFDAAKSFMKDTISKGIEFHAFKQASEVAFTTFLGDAEKAKKYMNDMYAFALKTPFSYPDLLASSRNLIAFGIEARSTFPIMQAIGDTVAAIGGGNQEMMGLADVFGAIQVSGKLSMMEVNRLGQYGVNAIEMLAKQSGVTADEMKSQISKGAIGAGQAIAVLVEGMNKQFGGMMEGVKGTWRGAIDSLKSASRNAGVKMMEDFMGPLTKSVNVVTDFLKKIPTFIGPAVAAFIPLIDMFNETFSEGRFDGIFAGLGAALTIVANILSWIGQLALWVAQVFADNWSWIAPIATVIGAALGTLVTMLMGYYTALGLIKVATLAWAAAQNKLNKAFFTSPIVWIIVAVVAAIALVIYAMIVWADQTAVVVGAIVGSFYWLGTAVWNILLFIANIAITVAEWFVNTWNQAVYLAQMAWIGFSLLAYMVLDMIGNAVLAAAEWFITTWNQAVYSVQLAWILFNVFVRSVFDGIINTAIIAAETFMNAWNDGVYGVQTAFYKMGSFVSTIASGVASATVGMVNSALSAISNLINTAATGINALIGMINKIPGVNISTIGSVNLKLGSGVTNFAANIGKSIAAPVKAATVSLGRMNTAGNYKNSVTMPTAPNSVNLGRLNLAGNYAANINKPKAADKVSFDRFEYASLSDAYAKGQKAGSNVSKKASDKLSGIVEKLTGLAKGKDGKLAAGPGDDLADLMNSPLGSGNDPSKSPGGKAGKANKPKGGKAPGGAGKKAPGAAGKKSNNPTGGKLDKIGKIDDEINIAEEDLKLLRELADIKSIQNFITLTPTVSLTGDMNLTEEADVDKIIKKIEKTLTDDVARSAKGVFD